MNGYDGRMQKKIKMSSRNVKLCEVSKDIVYVLMYVKANIHLY